MAYTGAPRSGYFRFMELIPTKGYVNLAIGSIALSALLRLMGKKDAALFVGQWAPTFLVMGLTHKLLLPSNERGFSEWQGAVNEAERMLRGSGSGRPR